MEVTGQLHAAAALRPRKGPLLPIEEEAGCDPEPVWMRWYTRHKILLGRSNKLGLGGRGMYKA